LAKIFVSPNTLDALFESGRNNVLDAAKAGGLFVNANIASTYLGMAAIAAWYIGRRDGSAMLRAVALLDWLAVFFTGSKAGLLCALIVPAALACISVLSDRRANPYTMFAVTIGMMLGAVALTLPSSQSALDHYRYDSMATLGTREDIWRFAVQMIRQHPFTGLGFGGWEQRFQLHGHLPGATAVPAHNSLVILWLQSGLCGLLGGLALIAAIYAAIVRGLTCGDAYLRPLAMALAGAFSWYVVQGLGENFGLVGEIHMTPFVGAILGHLCAHLDRAAGRYEHPQNSMHCAVAASAVPAL
jgi:O-antigen ligase